MKLAITKLTIKNLCCLLVIVLSLGACKKDALEIKEEKEFIQAADKPVTDLYGGGMDLILRPEGKAYLNPSGDILWAATYDISGKKITVKVPDLNREFKFTIISDTEIHGPDGQVLKLTK